MKRVGFSRIAASVGMIAMIVVFLLPFYICIVTAMKTPTESAISTLALPGSFRLDNFKEALEVSHFSLSVINSLKVTSLSVICIVMMSAMGGYVLCRRNDRRAYRAVNQILVMGLMIPFQVIMIPAYRMFNSLNLINTHFGVILLMIGTSMPYSIFLMTGFIRSVPVTLEESAKLDGCSVCRTFFQIVFPLLKPIVGTVAILHTLWMWNEFNISVIFLQKNAVRTIPIQQYFFFGEYTINLNLGFASACVSMLPIIAFFLLGQRALINGITAGAVKG
jgi:raffinose/stachyose/melibiose transport system permease protein